MVPIDIIIGTVPLRSSFSSFLPANPSLITVQQDPVSVVHGTSLLTLDKYPDLRKSIFAQLVPINRYYSTLSTDQSYYSLIPGLVLDIVTHLVFLMAILVEF